MKIKWEKPGLFDLADGLRALGSCQDGSGDAAISGYCFDGGADATGCGTGNAARGGGCDSGTLPNPGPV